MANTCFNTIRITGPQADLERLHSLIAESADKQEQGSPKRGLELLLWLLGCPDDQTRRLDTREDFFPHALGQPLTLSDGVLSLTTKSDWDFKNEAWAAVRQTLPGIEIHYLSVTSSLSRIVTNDTEHRFFDISVHYSRDENLSR